ncbi:FUSC family protein [Nocardioides sp. JQ2195]|uniref:FUSC family protein n=1 Tax=Nocardioides sp. JQ2195 TaxID=2592334 RepID=UPI00143E9453|nr:FUSC family protein [Nocardioides sp. JQ2195]QIX26658.1 FUSC family protein [Nocardioides sp. JQ2195]
MRFTDAFRASERAPLLQMVKTALATMLAWIVAGLAIPDGPPPVFAAIAAMLVVQPSLNQSLFKGIERSVGVIAGVVLASGLSIAFGGASWVVLLAVSASLALAWGLRMTTGSANQVAISALLVLAIGSSSSGYATYRILETFLGAVIGIIVHLVLVPPVALVPAHRALDALGEEIAVSLERLAHALTRKHSSRELRELMTEARQLHALCEATDEALDQAEDSLALNPRGRHHREDLAAMRDSVENLSLIVTQVLGMTRAYVDQYDDSVSNEPAVQAIAEELRRAAHDTRRELRITLATRYETFAETAPALTAPLVFQAPKGMRWILVGSLMEDLRRIREELGARG